MRVRTLAFRETLCNFPRVVIRAAGDPDAGTIAALLGELGFPADTGTVRHRLEYLRAAHEHVLVAERDGQVAGVMTLHVTPVLHRPAPVGRITALVVSSAARRRGIGRALVEAAERLLSAEGCGLIEITSNLRLEQAHAFYLHLGYEVTSHRFKKSLTPPRQPSTQ